MNTDLDYFICLRSCLFMQWVTSMWCFSKIVFWGQGKRKKKPLLNCLICLDLIVHTSPPPSPNTTNTSFTPVTPPYVVGSRNIGRLIVPSNPQIHSLLHLFYPSTITIQLSRTQLPICLSLYTHYSMSVSLFCRFV